MDYVEKMTLIGDNRKGARFGSAIASVGDLNKDGFQGLCCFKMLRMEGVYWTAVLPSKL